MTNDRQQGKVLGEFAVKKLGGKRVAIIDDRSAYGQGLADEVEKAVKATGGAVVAREYTNDRATDFTAILTSIKGKNPDLVFFGGMDPQGAPMVKQMHGLGLNAKFLGGDGAQTTEFLKLAGKGFRRRDRVLAGPAARRDAGWQEFPRQVHGQVRPDSDLRALRLRRDLRADRSHRSWPTQSSRRST